MTKKETHQQKNAGTGKSTETAHLWKSRATNLTSFIVISPLANTAILDYKKLKIHIKVEDEKKNQIQGLFNKKVELQEALKNTKHENAKHIVHVEKWKKKVTKLKGVKKQHQDTIKKLKKKVQELEKTNVVMVKEIE